MPSGTLRLAATERPLSHEAGAECQDLALLRSVPPHVSAQIYVLGYFMEAGSASQCRVVQPFHAHPAWIQMAWFWSRVGTTPAAGGESFSQMFSGTRQAFNWDCTRPPVQCLQMNPPSVSLEVGAAGGNSAES